MINEAVSCLVSFSIRLESNMIFCVIPAIPNEAWRTRNICWAAGSSL